MPSANPIRDLSELSAAERAYIDALCPEAESCSVCNSRRRAILSGEEVDDVEEEEVSGGSGNPEDRSTGQVVAPDDPTDEVGDDVPVSATRPWLKIGVELEGGWNFNETRVRELAARFGANFHYDGSVHTGADLNAEISTKPYATVGRLLNAMEEMYPHEVNNSCGMHVHVSFDEHVYGTLMSQKFYFYFLLRWEAWGKRLNIRNPEFWSRLKGENQYCLRNHAPVGQMTRTSRDGIRYAHLNYCYALHGTIECRLLPMFKDKAIAGKAIRELVSIYEDYLEEYGKDAQEEMIDLTGAPPIGDHSEETITSEVELGGYDSVELRRDADFDPACLAMPSPDVKGAIRTIIVARNVGQFRDRVYEALNRQNNMNADLLFNAR